MKIYKTPQNKNNKPNSNSDGNIVTMGGRSKCFKCNEKFAPNIKKCPKCNGVLIPQR